MWILFKASILDTATRSCGQKIIGTCCGANPRTQWWTPGVRKAVKLKKEAWLTQGFSEAAERQRQARRAASAVIVDAKTR